MVLKIKDVKVDPINHKSQIISLKLNNQNLISFINYAKPLTDIMMHQMRHKLINLLKQTIQYCAQNDLSFIANYSAVEDSDNIPILHIDIDNNDIIHRKQGRQSIPDS